MFKFVFSAVVCAAMCIPAASFAQDCGCGCEPAPAPCVKTRKRLKLVTVQKEVCKLKRVCTTDECGCQKSELVRVKETVCRKKLALVDTPVDPCRGRLFARVGSRLKSMGSRGCCDEAPSCGCEEPAPSCGCEAAAPMEYSAPAMEYSAPVEAAPMMVEPAAESVLGN